MVTRLVVQTGLWLAAMGVILFAAAGDWLWPQGWIFLGEIAVLSFAVSFWLLRHDPALLASRLSSPVQRDQMGWDRLFMLAVCIVFIGWMVLIALDARRFAWSRVPIGGQMLGGALMALSLFLVWQVFRFNSFAAPQVRIQAARAHRVVSDGPYRIVRHPMYAVSILYLLGMPLLLGSWWGVAVVPLFVVAFASRVVGEERMLRRELAGYEAYAKHVRYRLIPGIW